MHVVFIIFELDYRASNSLPKLEYYNVRSGFWVLKIVLPLFVSLVRLNDFTTDVTYILVGFEQVMHSHLILGALEVPLQVKYDICAILEELPDQ